MLALMFTSVLILLCGSETDLLVLLSDYSFFSKLRLHIDFWILWFDLNSVVDVGKESGYILSTEIFELLYLLFRAKSLALGLVLNLEDCLKCLKLDSLTRFTYEDPIAPYASIV